MENSRLASSQRPRGEETLDVTDEGSLLSKLAGERQAGSEIIGQKKNEASGQEAGWWVRESGGVRVLSRLADDVAPIAAFAEVAEAARAGCCLN